jgi:transposase-like protein
MIMQKNRYVIRARISERKFRDVIRYFAADLEAKKIANFVGLSRRTLNKYLTAIRKRIVEECKKESLFSGEVEMDESFFGPRRQKGKRGRGALGKTKVFGLLKRQGKVYTQIVKDCSKRTLQAIIRGKVDINSIVHSDGWKGYDGLVDLGYKKHHRVNHSQNEFARGKSHINGIENFWGIAKVRLSKFRGIHKSTFHLHLKECEFRFNHRKENIRAKLLKSFKKSPLKFP